MPGRSDHKTQKKETDARREDAYFHCNWLPLNKLRSEKVGEKEIDAALDSADPIEGLNHLALAEVLRPIVARAIARVKAIEDDHKARARLAERKPRKRGHILGT